MRPSSHWYQALLAQVERMPIIGHMQSGKREGLLLGAVCASLALLLIGGALGWLNRGTSGAVVGAFSGALAGAIGGGIVGALLGLRYLPQSGTVSVALELENADGRESYAPGECIQGAVEIAAHSTLRIGECKVYFVCYGSYAHDRVSSDNSSMVHFEQESRQYLLVQADLASPGVLRRGSSCKRPFRFAIPEGALPTHLGHICSVRWSLHAIVDVPDLMPVEAHREVVIETPPVAPVGTTANYQSVLPAQVCQLILTLPRADYCEGETIVGRVHVTPMQRLDVDELRVVLLRIENTPFGDDHIVYVTGIDAATSYVRGEREPGGHGTTYVWFEDEATCLQAQRLETAEVASFSFELPIPIQWRPTLTTKDGRVTWKVGAILSRAGHADLRAFHEVIIHTRGSVRGQGQPLSAAPLEVGQA